MEDKKSRARGPEQGWQWLVANDPNGKWWTAKGIAGVTGAKIRTVNNWLTAWIADGRVEVRSGSNWGREVRRATSVTQALPTAPPAHIVEGTEHHVLVEAYLPRLIEIVKTVAADTSDPRGSYAANKIIEEFGLGPVRDEQPEDDSPDETTALVAAPDLSPTAWDLDIETIRKMIATLEAKV